MMTEKILKIAKGLGKFHIDEMCIISELPEEDVLKILEYLVTEQVLRKAGNSSYQYIGKMTIGKRKEQQNPKKECQLAEESIQIPFKPQEIIINEEDIYNYPEWARKKAIKYLKVIQSSKGLYGAKLQLFLKQWNEQYPEMKVGYSSLMREKRKLIQEGVSGLLAQYGKHKGKTSVTNEMYIQFRDLYLSHARLSAITCWQKVKDNYKEVVHFPSHNSFIRRLKKEFTGEEIRKFRTV